MVSLLARTLERVVAVRENVKGLYVCAIYDHTKPVGTQTFPESHSGRPSGYPILWERSGSAVTSSQHGWSWFIGSRVWRGGRSARRVHRRPIRNQAKAGAWKHTVLASG